ncbi:hypothetical protein LNO81_08595 [Klebsiella variicola subsp. variicola]|nr:hypothetical protein [Klebsiella variicola subsp. variicola]
MRRYFAGWRLTPYPAYRVQTQYVNRRRTWGRWKLPVLAASTSLRRSRKAGAARRDAG